MEWNDKWSAEDEDGFWESTRRGEADGAWRVLSEAAERPLAEPDEGVDEHDSKENQGLPRHRCGAPTRETRTQP